MLKRDDSFPVVSTELSKHYKINDLTRVEYEDLCHSARMTRVEQIMSREDRSDSEEGSKLCFRMFFRRQEIYVIYLTPDDLIVHAPMKEHVVRALDESKLEDCVLVRNKKPEIVFKEEKDDLLKDLLEVGVDV